MPFIRYSRDKRGYETTVVLHAYRPGQGAQRSRVLYMFRSPSNLKVGRRALDEEVTQALEHTHPDLAFDWQALQREIGHERPDYREREHSRRPPPRRPESRPEARPAAPPPPPPPVVEDLSPLGRTLGSSVSARLRGRFSDLLQKIARRARTPEERDRLTERAVRLNPDEWPDEATMRSGAQTVEAEWDAIAAELPQLRRGRRGGRNRREPWPATAGPGPSGIMTGQGESNAPENTGGVAGEDRGSDAAGQRDVDGPGDVDASAGSADRLHEDG